MPPRFSIACLLTILSLPAAAQPVPPGPAQRTVRVGTEALTVHTYRPACSDPSLLVVFHGLHQNAPGYRDYARKLADQNCMIVAAPLFDSVRFPRWRYQHGGLARRGVVQPSDRWTGHVAVALVQELRRIEGRNLAYSLLGHSGGAQFLMRLAASVPNDARRIVIANPGTLVWADIARQAPYGLGGLAPARDGEALLRRYLAQPITIYLGRDDTELEDLSQAPEAQEQGDNRHERGLAVFRAAEAKARELSLPFHWRLVEVDGVGHTARRMLSRREASQALQP